MKKAMTYKYSFQNDYSEGAHSRILEALAKNNDVQEDGYGEDRFCLAAADMLRREIGNTDAGVHLIGSGTLTNLLMLSSMLRPFESVIAVESGHICVHETGAIEATGHKINNVAGVDGKVTVREIEETVIEHHFEHMVKPRAVYISQSSEIGTIYSLQELQQLSEVCKKLDLYLYMDGARLGSALTSSAADFDIKELSRLVDAFYIGGTKNGALLGEALVINNSELQPYFRYHIKQRGAMLAKGRVLGVQFVEFFKDGLYYELARHANRMAGRLSQGMQDMGYASLTDSPTNQIFPILPDTVIEKLSLLYHFYVWERVDDRHSAVRLVTSWATPPQAVDGFLEDLKQAA